MAKGGVLPECGSYGHEPMIRMSVTEAHTAVLTGILTGLKEGGLQ